MKSKDPFLRMAIRLQNYFRHPSPASRCCVGSTTILDHAQRLQHQMDLSQRARNRGWSTATARTEESARYELAMLQRVVQQAVADAAAHTLFPQPTVQPTLRELYDDLRQLDQEFEEVKLDPPNGVISAVTEPIELDDIFLGHFEIRLLLEKLRENANSSAFEIVALDPHPASTNESITHPHVQSEKLCAGEATVSIATSLRAGRLCDAFLAVNSVLHTYNSHSPYVALSDWTGTACEDCGSIMGEDESYFCEGCDRDYCGECIRMCGCCDESRCRGCLEEDRVSGVLSCRHCQKECGECGRMVDAGSFDQESNLCPGCLERRQEQEEQTESEESKQTHELEINHEQQQRDCVGHAGTLNGDPGGTRVPETGAEFTSTTAQGAG